MKKTPVHYALIRLTLGGKAFSYILFVIISTKWLNPYHGTWSYRYSRSYHPPLTPLPKSSHTKQATWIPPGFSSVIRTFTDETSEAEQQERHRWISGPSSCSICLQPESQHKSTSGRQSSGGGSHTQYYELVKVGHVSRRIQDILCRLHATLNFLEPCCAVTLAHSPIFLPSYRQTHVMTVGCCASNIIFKINTCQMEAWQQRQ